MSRAPRFFRLTNNRNTRYVVSISIAFAVGLMCAFEYLQLVLHPDITLLESRVYTVLFVGTLVGLVSYFIKQRENSFIAERNRAQRVLRESEERFKKLALHIPGVVFQFKRRTDGTFCVPFTTDGITEIFGCSPLDVRESFDPIFSVVVEEDKEALIESFELSAARLDMRQHEYRVKVSGQPKKWLLSHSTPERLADGSTIWYGHVVDITKYRLAGDERVKLQKLESLGILAGGIAHDFNNILTAIMANASMVSATIINDNQKHSLESIVKATERATGLTRQLLAFARGGIPSVKPTSLCEVIRDSAEFVLGKNTKSTYELDLAPDLWFVNADALQIAQVIQNLVINAHQAMPDGGTIRIRAVNGLSRREAGIAGDYIRICVSDDGVGIPSKYIERIFEPYFTTKGEGAGSGLGLSVVYRIIEKHNGKITVRSKQGEGATFSIFLPALSDIQTISVEKEEQPTQCARLNILAMDDDPMMQEVLTDALQMLGHNVTMTSRGEEAIEAYQATAFSGEPFDLVLLDLTIPGGMGGEETLARLLAINPDLIAIISSGYADKIPAGFKAALPKPYQLKTLVHTINEAMEHSKYATS